LPVVASQSIEEHERSPAPLVRQPIDPPTRLAEVIPDRPGPARRGPPSTRRSAAGRGRPRPLRGAGRAGRGRLGQRQLRGVGDPNGVADGGRENRGAGAHGVVRGQWASTASCRAPSRSDACVRWLRRRPRRRLGRSCRWCRRARATSARSGASAGAGRERQGKARPVGAGCQGSADLKPVAERLTEGMRDG
jgi:hypothetical protein